MVYTPPDSFDASERLPRIPAWITAGAAEAPEDAAFSSGAALAILHAVLSSDAVPQALLRDRLALRAAEACMAASGRPERAGALRDAAHFLQPGDRPGPAGEVYLSCRRAVARPVSVDGMQRALPAIDPIRITQWWGHGRGAPVARAASVLETVLTEAPRGEVAALVLADAALARALGRDHLIPLLAAGMRRGALRLRGDDLRLACHRAVTASAVEAVRLAAELTRRTDRLALVAPKLRAKGAGAAVEMFRTRDAVAPTALPLPDRAARRLCDRLVALGAVRELTGRDTFRLYGV